MGTRTANHDRAWRRFAIALLLVSALVAGAVLAGFAWLASRPADQEDGLRRDAVTRGLELVEPGYVCHDCGRL